MPDAPEYPTDKQPSIRRMLMPRDTNALGTIFGGVILAEIDLAAAIEAEKHHAGRVVTVAMDRIVFHDPVFLGDIVSFFTDTVRTGRTSVTVEVCVWAHRAQGGEPVQVTEAQVTLVAVDEDFRPTPLNQT